MSFASIIDSHLLPSINFDLDRMADDACVETLELFEETNRKQLRLGLDAVGDSLGTYRSYGGLSYKRTKLRPVNLKLTGDFYRSISADAFSNGVEISSSISFLGELEYKYGKDILGINFDAITANYLVRRLTSEAQKSILAQIRGR